MYSVKCGSEEIRGAVQDALEAGYRHIDVAYSYGNEYDIGCELQRSFARGLCSREEVFVTTKLPHFAMKECLVRDYLHKSLVNLQLGYVDLYLIEFPVGVNRDPATQQETLDLEVCHRAIWKQMEEQVYTGYTKAIGLSNFNARQIENILRCARILPSNAQMEMHLYCQQKELVQFCKCRNITVTAYAPLGSPAVYTSLQSNVDPWGTVLMPLTDPRVMEIARKKNVTCSQILLRYLLQMGVAAIPKSSGTCRIRNNAKIFHFNLDDCDMYVLNALDRGESGRIFDAKVWTGLDSHPEFPFHREE
ncbi:hypothetical protein AAG570_003112 [Ranatra chinensis]|uniref:NADP-dependent oxidoreductase domain-containing protein n=1 Tax=Ranatra chinensis TaxID=642074 RepID=A0ABD0Y5V9_9HEMI